MHAYWAVAAQWLKSCAQTFSKVWHHRLGTTIQTALERYMACGTAEDWHGIAAEEGFRETTKSILL